MPKPPTPFKCKRIAHVLREAAALVDGRTNAFRNGSLPSCWAIERVQNNLDFDRSPARVFFHTLYECDHLNFYDMLRRLGHLDRDRPTTEAEHAMVLDVRVMALCLAAAIAEGGGL